MKDEHGIISSRSQGFIDFAYLFAKKAHEGQLRRYTNDPYIVHPIAVAKTVSAITEDCDMIAAAFLHDVVEDTPITIEEIKFSFGWRCASFVEELTEFSVPEDGNRVLRKALDARYLARASAQAKTIKLADLLDNCISITQHSPGFAVVFMKEMRHLLTVLEGGDSNLMDAANLTVKAYFLAKDRP